MLKTVSWTSLKLLAWYSTLLIGFSLSFFLLFRDCTNESNLFTSQGMAMFKTITMMVGELDSSNIPFSAFPGISHVAFLTFVFLVVIVLVNLLNGLAVSDTQAIRNDAELVQCEARVRLVALFEKVSSLRSFWVLQKLRLTRHVRLFCDKTKYTGIVLPNKFVEEGNFLDFISGKQQSQLWIGERSGREDKNDENVKTDTRSSQENVSCCLQSAVIKAASDLLAKRRNAENEKQSQEDRELRWERLERKVDTLETLLHVVNSIQ